jgi:hypothetical protein
VLAVGKGRRTGGSVRLCVAQPAPP